MRTLTYKTELRKVLGGSSTSKGTSTAIDTSSRAQTESAGSAGVAVVATC